MASKPTSQNGEDGNGALQFIETKFFQFVVQFIETEIFQFGV